MKLSWRQRTPAPPTPYKLLSLLLQYPDARLLDARGDPGGGAGPARFATDGRD